MDPYADEVLEALGIPTNIKRLRDLNFYQILRVAHTANAQEVHQAASAMIRKLRDFEKGPTLHFAHELEREIIRARTTLSDPEAALKYLSSLEIAPQITIVEEEKAPSGRTGFEKVKVPERPPRRFGWVFWIILLILVLIAVKLIPWRKVSKTARGEASEIQRKVERATER